MEKIIILFSIFEGAKIFMMENFVYLYFLFSFIDSFINYRTTRQRTLSSQPANASRVLELSARWRCRREPKDDWVYWDYVLLPSYWNQVHYRVTGVMRQSDVSRRTELSFGRV